MCNFVTNMISPIALIQLKAFARQDGLFIGGLWIATLACLLASLNDPTYNLGVICGILATPFVAFARLKHFRDKVLEGSISFRRAFAFVTATLFYASLILAAAALIYLQFFDKGALFQMIQSTITAPEIQESIKQAGMNMTEINAQVELLSKARPIDFACNIVANGIVNALILAAILGFIGKKNKEQ